MDEKFIQLWNQIKQGNRENPCLFSYLTITTIFMVKQVLSMPLRGLQEFINSLVKLVQLPRPWAERLR
ncbi:transposase [Candidatus Enterovibrio altilux]|uniref:transposase n=1 Tax=Candidatus Enterovibrio altilux TaxID=1927128 RepID=UPI0021E00FCC|nr:transposase [Candidatus Enterovibrio luxaltus]